MKAKKQSALSRLMKIAGKHKYFSYASCVLAAISAWVALIPLLAMVLYIGALMCSHKAAFRVQTNMRITMMNHIMKLPLGYV